MGTRIVATSDHQSKSQYGVTFPSGDAVDAGPGELVMWFGEGIHSAPGYFAGQISLHAMRELGWPDPDGGNQNYAVTRVGDGLADSEANTSLLPTFEDDDVVILQGSGFTGTADSNSGHIKRMLEKWREVNIDG